MSSVPVLLRRRILTRTLFGFLRYALSISLALIFVFPIYWMIASSFKDFAGFYALPPVFFPWPLHWQNYVEMLVEYPILRYVFNSIFVGVSVSLGQLLVTSLAGYAFATLSFKWKKFLFILFLSGMMVPLSVILIPLYYIVNLMKMLNTYWGMIIPCVFSGYGIFLMRQFFMGIPRDLHDAGVIDGCSEFSIYWRIYIPLSIPVFVTLGIQCFVYFYNSFLWPLIVVSNQLKKTVPVGLAEFLGRETQWPHLIMAGATIGVLPTILIFIALQKYYIRGIATTGIKV